MATLANSEDPDEMQHNDNAAFHHGLYLLLRLKQPSWTEQHKLEKSTCDLLTCTTDSPILIVSICMEKSTRKQWVYLGICAT